MDEFLDLHYGSSAPPIRRFIEHVHDRAEASGIHRHCYGNLIHYGLDETDAQAGLDAFAEALRLADSDVIRARVEQASICAYRAAIEPVYYATEQEPVSPVMVQRFRPLVKQFFELCDRYHVDRPRESREDIGEARRRLKAAFGEPADGPF